jgi:hypothetical protein
MDAIGSNETPRVINIEKSLVESALLAPKLSNTGRV